MITVVCWRWSTPGYRSTFGPDAVNVMRQMVARHYPAPHRFACVTNDPAGIDPEVEIIPDREDFAGIVSPHGAGNPSCYRRLRLFESYAAATIGERIVSIDLDCVITGDLRPLWDRRESFVGWQDPLHAGQINGSMMLLTAGAHPEVWDWFDPATSPAESLAAGYKGSDQGWISQCLPDAARWTRADGVLSYRIDKCTDALPAGAKVVMFHGRLDPWSPEAQRAAWVRENWRL